MARVDFYRLTRDPVERVLPAIATRILDGGNREPILLSGTLGTPAINGATHVALADGEWREEALAFERAFLLFDNSRIDDARATWRALTKAEGVEIHFWKQDERGRWSEGP